MQDLYDDYKDIYENNHFAIHNHMYVSAVNPDHAEVYLDVAEEHTNPFGNVHGGAYFSLADYAAGMAARTDKRHYVTLNSSVNFMRGVSEGRITAKADVLNRGRTCCVIEVTITSEAGKKLFYGTFTFFCLDR